MLGRIYYAWQRKQKGLIKFPVVLLLLLQFAKTQVSEKRWFYLSEWITRNFNFMYMYFVQEFNSSNGHLLIWFLLKNSNSGLWICNFLNMSRYLFSFSWKKIRFLTVGFGEKDEMILLISVNVVSFILLSEKTLNFRFLIFLMTWNCWVADGCKDWVGSWHICCRPARNSQQCGHSGELEPTCGWNVCKSWPGRTYVSLEQFFNMLTW